MVKITIFFVSLQRSPYSQDTRLKAKLLILILFGIVSIFIHRCAKVGTPSGGRVDETPPQIKKSIPANYSKNVQARKFEITFDEYVQLREVNQKLLVSPPLEERPEIRLKGKSLIVELSEDLIPNTTYTFNFFDAIADNNEGNPLENFEFVISTGTEIDSLSISGNVIRAFDLALDENVYIILHENLEDSAFTNLVPDYVSKADESGNFRLNNLKADTFRLYALKDANMNYRYDQPGEWIAFNDSIIVVKPKRDSYEDTNRLDSTALALNLPVIQNLELYLFQEEKFEQYLKSAERKGPEHLLFVFNEPLTMTPEINLVERDAKDSWYQPERYMNGDSVGFWISDTAISSLEFLDVEVLYLKQDSTSNLVTFRDTVTLRYTKPAQPRTRGRDTEPEEETPERIRITSNVSGNRTFDLNGRIRLETTSPIQKIDTSRIELLEVEDTLQLPVAFQFTEDSLGQRIFYVSLDWKENTSYNLTLFPGALIDLYNMTHDTTALRFKTQAQAYYGAILLTVSNIKQDIIVQLLDGKDEVLKETSARKDSLITFRYLKPGQYKLKSIVDWNANGAWDTGDFIKKIQPEEVLLYPEDIQVRSNWEYEIDWIIQTYRTQKFTDSLQINDEQK